VNTELLLNGNNRDVVEVQEIQTLALTACTTLINKTTLHFAPKNYASVSHGSVYNKRLFSKKD